MKPLIFICTALVFSSMCLAQKQNVYFLKNDGTAVQSRDSADVIRILREPDTGAVNFKVLEYYKNGKLKFAGESSTVEPLTFEGSALSYYPNAKRSTIEQFEHGVKKASYTYYINGKPQAIRAYPEDLAGANKYKNFTVTSFNDTTGKALVTDGNGDFAGFEIEMNDRYAEGKIVNGKKEGLWKGNYPADKIAFIEEYQNGNLLTGTCTTEKNKKYTYHTEVALLNVGNPDGPTLNLAISSNVVLEPAPIFHTEIGTVTTRIIAVPAGTNPNSSRVNFSPNSGNFGTAPNIDNLQAHGTTIVSFKIDKTGRAVDFRVRKSLNEDLDRLALKSATDGIRRKTNNTPSILMGKPIETQYTIPITF